MRVIGEPWETKTVGRRDMAGSGERDI